MKKILFFTLITVLFSNQVDAQSDRELITRTINQFIFGTVYNYQDSVSAAFHPNTKMFLWNGTDTAFHVTSETYASWYGRKEPGTINNRPSKIIAMDIEGDVAYAKLQVDMPDWGNRFFDLLLLKKIRGNWKIISKATSSEPIPKTPQELISKPTKEVVLENLNHPWSIAFLGENDVLIAEKDGAIIRVNLETKERTEIQGLPKDVGRAITIDTTKFEKGIFHPSSHGNTASYNAGWFQVLLDPNFKENHYLYLSYAAENEERASTTKVIRGILENDRLTNVETLFIAEPYSHGLFHYGGGMLFGDDGKLYISIGERNFYEYMNPEIPTAQNVSDKRGKIIRINPNGSIPSDNPDFGKEAIAGLYAIGIRATQGLTINPETGTIYFSEHGTIQGDELNILEFGANYGWPNVTSGKYRSDYQPKEIPGAVYTNPIHFWDQTIAPTGLVFYDGRDFPQWKGNLIVPGLSKGNLWRIILQDNVVVGAEELFINDRVRLRKAAISPRGQLYILTDEDNGKLIRIVNENR